MADAGAPEWFLVLSLLWDMLAFTMAGHEGWTLLKNPVVPHSNTTVFIEKMLVVTMSRNICSCHMDGGITAKLMLLSGPEKLLADLVFTRGIYLAA